MQHSDFHQRHEKCCSCNLRWWRHGAGGRPRGENEDRIEFLAHVRNMALEPVFPAPVAGEAVGEHRNASVSARLLGAAEGGGRGAAAASGGGTQGEGGAAEAWTPDRVVFINDVFFCMRDVVRARVSLRVS